MFAISRPDTTDEGWNSWPTEKVSHALVRKPPLRAATTRATLKAATAGPTEAAVFQLASQIRGLVEQCVRQGDAPDLREYLVAYALSRVDWFQLADAHLESAVAEALGHAA